MAEMYQDDQFNRFQENIRDMVYRIRDMHSRMEEAESQKEAIEIRFGRLGKRGRARSCYEQALQSRKLSQEISSLRRELTKEQNALEAAEQQWEQEYQAALTRAANAKGARSREIESLPCKKVRRKDLGVLKEKQVVCSVCLGDYEIGDVAVRLPCRHYFHKQCISDWLKENNSCPLCRDESIKTPHLSNVGPWIHLY